jgi:Zn-dependent protease with chaperone function
MVHRFEASYFDGTSATAWPVVVEIASDQLLVQSPDGAIRFSWQRSALSITRHSRSYATIQNTSTLELIELHDVAAIKSLGEGGPFGIHRFEGYRGFALLLSVIVASGALLYLSANRLSSAIAQKVPLRYERKLGDALNPFAVFGEECKTESGQKALAKIVARLEPARALEAQVHVVKNRDVNAYAFLGSQIYVLSGLINEAQSPAEVAGVLAHELGHASERHVLASLLRSTFLTTIWTAAMGDFSGLLVVDPATIKQLAELKYSREYEEGADRFALETLRASRLSATGLRDFFERLSKVDGRLPGALKIVSSHPMSASRAQAVTAFIEGNPELTDTKAGLTDDEWLALKSICLE